MKKRILTQCKYISVEEGIVEDTVVETQEGIVFVYLPFIEHEFNMPFFEALILSIMKTGPCFIQISPYMAYTCLIGLDPEIPFTLPEMKGISGTDGANYKVIK